mgnify:CR=1 FL=1
MNYNSYAAPADPTEITLPSDGTVTPYDLNPVAGVQQASATPADAPVMVGGIQLSAQQAREYGFLASENTAQIDVNSTPSSPAPVSNSPVSDSSQNDVHNSSGDDDDSSGNIFNI